MKEVRLSPETKDIPVIVLTAKNKDSDMNRPISLLNYLDRLFLKISPH